MKKIEATKENRSNMPLVTNESAALGSAVMDPAYSAGLPKVTYYQTDKWVVLGKGPESVFVSPKNVLPEPLVRSFVRSPRPDPVTEQAIYDREKFLLDEFPDFNDPTGENSRVTTCSHETKKTIAAVAFHRDTFVVELFSPQRAGVFPFNKDEFLKAVNAAKWILERYVLPDSDRE